MNDSASVAACLANRISPNGIWDKQLSCNGAWHWIEILYFTLIISAIECSRPELANSNVQCLSNHSSNDKVFYGESCEIHCLDGYYLNGTMSFTCKGFTAEGSGNQEVGKCEGKTISYLSNTSDQVRQIRPVYHLWLFERLWLLDRLCRRISEYRLYVVYVWPT